jgi:hypothetical protein
MKTLIPLASVLVLAALSGGPENPPLTVHEWGTFTSVSASDGAPLVWNPFSGPSELPSFVYVPDSRREEALWSKLEYTTTIRMETPVLYFYAGEELDVNVRVDFPKGAITEWYPKARSVKREGLDWGRIRVRPGAPEEFPRETGASHYYPARETGAAPIRVSSPGLVQDEKFLFYRGVGWFPPPLRITLSNERIRVTNSGPDPVPAILFENRGGKTGFRVLGALRGEVGVAPPDLTTPASEAMAALEKLLIRSGLYEKEARAMLNTWRDSWFEEGLRVFYLVPRAAVDSLLPLSLDPKPLELARVFVGRAEILTPAMERRMRDLIKRCGEDYPTFSKEIQVFGRFAEPLLQRIVATLLEEELGSAVRLVLKRY